MSTIIINPIPYTPGSVAVGTHYTPDSETNYVTIPNVDIGVNLQIPAETFEATYLSDNQGKTISHTKALIADTKIEMVGTDGYLRITFNSQVFFTDGSRDFNVIEASIKVAKPNDFNSFTIVGPFYPVIPDTGGSSAAFDSTDPSKITFSININTFTLPVMGAANIKVQVATGTFT